MCRQHHVLLTLLIPAIAATCAFPGAGPVTASGQHDRHFEKQVPVKLDYLLYLPEGYAENKDKKWPLIFFLHGAGERGSNLAKVKVHGPPKIVESKKDFQFVVVSPQCPANRWWEPFHLDALLEDVLATYRVDPDRVYLTGLSMGGFGTWDYAARYPHRFAAIAPICGGGSPRMAAFRLRRMPVWVFHGDADPVVPVALSDAMVEELKKAGANVKYTRYEGVAHDSWTKTYDNPELYTWFLAHTRAPTRRR